MGHRYLRHDGKPGTVRHQGGDTGQRMVVDKDGGTKNKQTKIVEDGRRDREIEILSNRSHIVTITEDAHDKDEKHSYGMVNSD